MERTKYENKTIYVGEFEFTRLMRQLIRNYRFMRENEEPTKVILPSVMEVEGVRIVKEVKFKKEVQDAVASG